MDYLAARGVWNCLRCGWKCADGSDDLMITCGQRETRYCATCLDNGPFEYVLVQRAGPAGGGAVQGTTPAPLLASATSIQNAILPVAHVVVPAAGAFQAAVQVGSVAPPQRRQVPLPDELSSLTPTQLQELQSFLEAMLLAVQKEAKDRTMCVVCCSSSKEVVFYPCKHKCVCAACSEKLAICPICRVPISDRILPYDA